VRKGKLIKVGRDMVKSARGFFWCDNHMIYVAEDQRDIDEFRNMGYGELHDMSELEEAFLSSTPLRFITWCSHGKRRCIVRQGATRVTFEYTTHKSVIRIK